MLLKTANGRNVCQQWAKSRLPGSRDEEMKAVRRGGNCGGAVKGVGAEGHLQNPPEPDISAWFQPADWGSNWQPIVLQSSPRKHLRQ